MANKPSAVPEGFEFLLEEQESVVDVYFGGRYVTSADARFTPDTVTFDDPAALVQQFPNVLDSKAVEKALTGALTTHQERRCYFPGQAGCGTLEPEVAGVIFDPDRFRADVFVNPIHLAVRGAVLDPYLPASDAGWSFIQTFNYAFDGEDSDVVEDSNLYSLSQLSYKENSLRMVGNYTDQDDAQIDTLAGQRDWRGKRYQLGWFLTDSQDLRFGQETDILGFRFGTSLDTREDLRQSTGNQIQVFLQSRGEVSLFKDDRLISTRIYDAGNQILDTSDLPGGSYDVEIRIRDAGGERTETRFYIKTQRIPPADMPLYFFEAGEINRRTTEQTLPEGTGEYLGRGGVNWRLNDHNAVFGGLSATGDDAVGQFGWLGLGRGYDVSLSGAVGNEDRYGVDTEFRFNWKGMWLSGNYRRIWGNENADVGIFDLLGPIQEQFGASLTAPVGVGRITLNGRYNDRPNQEIVRTATLGYETPSWRFGDSSLQLRFEYTRDDHDDFARVSLRWRMNRGHWSYNVTPEYVYEDTSSGEVNDWRATAGANWDSREMFSSDVRAGVVATRDVNFESVGADVDWGGRYGRARFQTERVFGEQDDFTRHNGNLGTSFIVAGKRAALGGKEQNQAALVVNLEGDPDTDAFFDILVDGVRRGTVRPGNRVVLTLRPFETYRVRLRARGEAFVHFDDREHSVTLYP
ncbi:MAG: TcfC E-set like domain-containing protein, partial [Pseudomonadota bacterium]